MTRLPKPKIVTYEEWLLMPEVKGQEVVDGVIQGATTSISNLDEIVADNLCELIQSDLNRADSKATVALCPRLRPHIPDLAVFQANGVEPDGYVRTTPLLIAEVLSPARPRRDFVDKLADYATLGVPEVWILSPEGRTVEVLYLEDGQLRRQAILAEGILKPRHFPDVQISIAEIWPD